MLSARMVFHVQDVVDSFSEDHKLDTPTVSRDEKEIPKISLTKFGGKLKVKALISQFHEGKDWCFCIGDAQDFLESIFKAAFICQGNSATAKGQD